MAPRTKEQEEAYVEALQAERVGAQSRKQNDRVKGIDAELKNYADAVKRVEAKNGAADSGDEKAAAPEETAKGGE